MGLLRALFSFKGRLDRSEYAVGFAIYVALLIGFVVWGGPASEWGDLGAILGLASIVVLTWILFATLAKRMHDIGKPGLMSLAVFIPIVGQFTPFVMLFYPGEPDSNLYGSSRPGWFVEP
jgi:uncharacterized membrane protein YhaH (DUF805 family)